jgi:hypothetical protein
VSGKAAKIKLTEKQLAILEQVTHVLAEACAEPSQLGMPIDDWTGRELVRAYACRSPAKTGMDIKLLRDWIRATRIAPDPPAQGRRFVDWTSDAIRGMVAPMKGWRDQFDIAAEKQWENDHSGVWLHAFGQTSHCEFASALSMSSDWSLFPVLTTTPRQLLPHPVWWTVLPSTGCPLPPCFRQRHSPPRRPADGWTAQTGARTWLGQPEGRERLAGRGAGSGRQAIAGARHGRSTSRPAQVAQVLAGRARLN